MRIDVADSEHPISRGMNAWEVPNEAWLSFRCSPGADCTVLFETGHQEMPLKAMAWVHEFKKARVFCMQPGARCLATTTRPGPTAHFEPYCREEFSGPPGGYNAGPGLLPLARIFYPTVFGVIKRERVTVIDGIELVRLGVALPLEDPIAHLAADPGFAGCQVVDFVRVHRQVV